MSIQYRIVFLILFNVICFSILAQKAYQQKNSLESVEHFLVDSADSIFVFEQDHSFSALVFVSPNEASYFLEISNEWIAVPKDEDVEKPTYFISLPRITSEIRLKVPLGETFDLFAISSGQPPVIDEGSRTFITQDCAEPLDVVLQSEWRDGLQPPSYGRSFHSVSHNIVHHSAGSNSNSNYTQVVRDIYLYHTQVNGWSDIGYNYLIAQDGTTYAGRDPDGGNQDEVRGAHFCGANSNALGVCLLGNYETANPLEETWVSLRTLLTYQLINQELDPFDSYNHPLGDIGTIAGHRDGCSTLCPGQNVYSQIASLKNEVNEAMQDCMDDPFLTFSVDMDSARVNEMISFNNESVSYDNYQWIFEGGFPSESTLQNPTISYDEAGVYDVSLIGIKGDVMDTLVERDYITISNISTTPVLYPNPAEANGMIRIESQEFIRKIELYQMNGKLLVQSFNGRGLQLPNIKPGVYILHLFFGSGVQTRKLLIK